MKQYVPMSADYFLFMNERDSFETMEEAEAEVKERISRRPSEVFLVLNVEKIIKSKDVVVDLEEVPLEDFSTIKIEGPLFGMLDPEYEGDNEPTKKDVKEEV